GIPRLLRIFRSGSRRIAGTVIGIAGTVIGIAGTVTGIAGTVTGTAGTVTGTAGTVTGTAGTVTGTAGTVTGTAGTVTGTAGTPFIRIINVTGIFNGVRIQPAPRIVRVFVLPVGRGVDPDIQLCQAQIHV